MNLIGFVGFKNAGKNTAALPLENIGYIPMSFAESIKDCLASIFQWPRDMLEGDTQESRTWRETVDEWWSKRLNIDDFTPRLAMQSVGTDIFRNHFHKDIWLASVERKIEISNNKKIVFTDIRNPNEIDFIRERNGKVYRIKKGNDPAWFTTARSFPDQMSILYPDVHETEYIWIHYDFITIENNGSIEELHDKVLSTCANV